MSITLYLRTSAHCAQYLMGSFISGQQTNGKGWNNPRRAKSCCGLKPLTRPNQMRQYPQWHVNSDIPWGSLNGCLRATLYTYTETLGSRPTIPLVNCIHCWSGQCKLLVCLRDTYGINTFRAVYFFNAIYFVAMVLEHSPDESTR